MVLEIFRSDIELCEAARRGDDDALLVMLARYQPIAELAARSTRLYGFDYEDIFSEANAALIDAVRAFDDGIASFGSYGRRCVRNRITSLVRKQRCRPILLQHVGTSQLSNGEGDHSEMLIDPTAEAEFDRAFALDIVAQIRAELDETENRVLTNLLARGGVLESPEADRLWREVASEMGCFRTGIWRVVNAIRLKAQGVIYA